MHTVIRTYSDPELADQLATRSDEVEELMSDVPGLRSYYLVRTAEGCTTITVCDDERGTDESSRRAAEWLREHASEIPSTAPQVTSGEVLIHAGVTARV
jgi:hypothetical protein